LSPTENPLVFDFAGRSIGCALALAVIVIANAVPDSIPDVHRCMHYLREGCAA
jgi:hypothetical protein